MRTRAVFDFVLDELKGGQSDRVEREVVGAAGVAAGQRRRPQIAERFKPGAEDRTHRLVALKVDAANLASAVVEVEIGRELFVSGFERERAWRSPRRAPLRPWGWARGVMFFNVSARADQSLLFAAPESDPDCAARLDAERLNDPHDLHRDSRSRAVVRGAAS